ncbi:DHA2 family efflux MFS transporter permease subunit [Catellatospora bangladeshensis]|nr:DHA2 family efflux MFS transporter permease subunit [Catellatospora bangladeshensis]
METGRRQPSTAWTWVAALVGVFMVAVDTLVVTTALPEMQRHLNVGISGLEWIVNSYTLTFAVFLLVGAALGDRFGRRLLLGLGLVIFTGASALAAAAPNLGTLAGSRALQGFGAAIIMPLTMTLLASVVPAEKRGHAFGLWGAMVGLGIALGPVVGGSITEALSWQWIFWINVPIGVLLLLIMPLVRESRGGAGRLDPLGTLLITVGLFGVVYGLIRGAELGWDDPTILTGLIGGGVLVLAFAVWERYAAAPMVLPSLFRSRGFTLTTVIAMIMPFGAFAAVFLGAQYLQTIMGYSPLEAGVRTLPMTAMPLIAAPLSGRLSDKIGGKPLVVLGLALLSSGIGWIGLIATPDLPYGDLVPPFILAGFGLGLFMPAVAALAINFAPANLDGVASGVTNAVRQVGTVLGVAVAGVMFAEYGGFSSPQSFVDGLVAAHKVAAVALAIGLLVAIFIPRSRPQGHGHGHGAGEQSTAPAPELAGVKG